jgi:hypothetical protein
LREKKVDQQVEYSCECGRHFIIVSSSGKQPKKCPKCARMMYPKEEEQDFMKPLQEKPKKGKNPLDNLEDTVEYEYTFDEKGRRVRKGSEPFTWKKFLKKIWTLFSFRQSSYRDY